MRSNEYYKVPYARYEAFLETEKKYRLLQAENKNLREALAEALAAVTPDHLRTEYGPEIKARSILAAALESDTQEVQQ